MGYPMSKSSVDDIYLTDRRIQTFDWCARRHVIDKIYRGTLNPCALTIGCSLEDLEPILRSVSASLIDKLSEGAFPLASAAPRGWIHPRISVVKNVYMGIRNRKINFETLALWDNHHPSTNRFQDAHLSWAIFFTRGNWFSIEFDVGSPDNGHIVWPIFVLRMAIMNPMQSRGKIVGLTLINLRQGGAFWTPPSTTGKIVLIARIA